MTTIEGKILIEDKLFKRDITGKIIEINKDSSLELYPADPTTLKPKAKKK